MCISEIAVLLGSDGRTVPLNEPGTLVVFRRERRIWLRNRVQEVSLDPAAGLAGMRKTVAALAGFLGSCKTIVAKSASGALFFELEKARCSVWEIAGAPYEFLDQVWHDEKEEQELAAHPLSAGADIPAPLEISPGKFSISIKEIQGKRPELSSKQVLRPFVRQGGFVELEIVCDHVPPWIETEAEQQGYRLQTERIALNEMKVVLRNISMGGGCC
jgi:Fe-only nitrogenase accessory protein AnfO